MKKALIFVLFIVLILVSCNDNQITTQSPVDPNVFYLASLPDIGDFSLNGGETSNAVTYEFVPSDDYGTIVPYIDSYRVFETPKYEFSDWYTQLGYASYGFMTKDCEIIMKASNKISSINYSETDDGFGYYTVRCDAEPNPDAPDENVFGETLVIPKDGSWCITLGEYSWISGAGDGHIILTDYPNGGDVKVSTVIYDYDGNAVKVLEGIENAGTFSQGLLSISEWSDNGYSTKYVDIDGNDVFGPFKYGNNFNKHGVTTVEDENGAYIMNTDGERLTDYYDSFFTEYSSDMSKQVFSGRRKENNKTVDVFSEKGEYLGTVSGSTYFSFRFPENGEIYAYCTVTNNDKYQTVSNRMMWKRLSDGTEFTSNEMGVGANSYSGHDNCYIYIDSSDKKGYFFDGNGDTFAKIDDVYDVVHVTPDNSFVMYITGEYDYSYNSEMGEADVKDSRVYHIYDVKQQKNVISMEGIYVSYMPNFGNTQNNRFVIIPRYLDSDDVFGGLCEYSVYDLERNELVFKDLNHVEMFGIDGSVYINTSTSNTSTIYDENYNVLKRFYFE